MVDDQILPIIRKYKEVRPVFSRQLKVAGEAESRVDARIDSVCREYTDVETTILSSPGIISLYFTWKGDPDKESATQQLDELVGKVREKLGKKVFSDQDDTLAKTLGELLEHRSLTIATAESCTGGLIGKLLTDVPGSSSYYLGSVVCYSNAVKERVLGVDVEALEREGAVSESVARQLAEGVRERLESDIGLATTGIAGPGGGSEEKPVGTVWLGLSWQGGTETRKLFLPGGREAVRMRSSNLALDWVRRKIL
jgi:nicotinamide-nucleotide amidase